MDDSEMRMDHGVRVTISAYARSIDGRAIDTCAALFREDASILVMGERHEGAAAVRAWLNSLAASTPGIHLTTNTLVEKAGPGKARATSDVAFIKRGAEGWRIVVAGQYVDELIETEGKWLFASRTISLS